MPVLITSPVSFPLPMHPQNRTCHPPGDLYPPERVGGLHLVLRIREGGDFQQHLLGHGVMRRIKNSQFMAGNAFYAPKVTPAPEVPRRHFRCQRDCERRGAADTLIYADYAAGDARLGELVVVQ